MKTWLIRLAASGCALIAPTVILQAGQDQANQSGTVVSPQAPSGAGLFTQHCASCHGSDLKGAGPFPPPYRTPPDLTTLARRHGGKFPAAYVAKVLRNGVKLPAHGPAEMPVWGSDFESKDKLDKAEVEVRIKALSNYIKSLQVK
jgi:mono/diheme cytochrome c family protein